MNKKTILSAYCIRVSIVAILVLFINNASTEITGFSGSRNVGFPENRGPDWTRIQHGGTRGVGVDGTIPSARRQSQTTGNVSLNQLEENLSRLEGNLASLIQSFLSLQRSVFNLEQLQELLVLLLEDILKQTGNMDQDGRVKDPSNPATTSSVSKESVDLDDDRDDVNSAEIDEDGDDIDHTDDKGTGGGEEDGEDDGVKTSDNGGKGGGDKGNGDPGTDPFAALNDINTPPTTSLRQPTQRENQDSVENKLTNKGGDDDNFHSADDSREMDGSNSIGSNEVIQRTHFVRPKPTSSNVIRESAVGRKPPVQEPLVTFAAQLEARLNDMIHRLTPFHGNHDRRMALLRKADTSGAFSSSTGESPMAPPPRFEPLEIVAANIAVPGKSPIMSSPVKVTIQREMSPIVSHGGPRVGPEDFSSHFMENLGGNAKLGSESLNERSTGMINNMVQFGQTAHIPSTNQETPHPSPSQPETLPSGTDRRRRQAKVKLSNTSYSSTSNSSLPVTTGNKSTIQISFVNLENNSNQSKNTKNISNTPYQLNAKITTPPLQTASATTTEDFDILIANLLQELSQHLQQQYLLNKHNASMGKDIDRAVLELNNLIWIPSSTTTQKSVVTSNTNPLPESSNTFVTFAASTPPSIATSLGDNNSKQKKNVTMKQKIGPSTLKDKTIQAENKQRTHAFESETNKSYDVAGAEMDHGFSDNEKSATPLPEKQRNGSAIGIKTTPSPPQSHSIPNTMTTDRDIVNSKQWDWLKQLPRADQANGGNLEWLIGMLSTISHRNKFSEELKSISNKGIELFKHFNKNNLPNQNEEIADSHKELESEDEPLSLDIDDDIESSSVEDSSEDFVGDTNVYAQGKELESTTTVGLEKQDSRVTETVNSKDDFQHSNSIFNGLSENQVNNDVNEMVNDQTIATRNEKDPKQLDDDRDDVDSENQDEDDEEDTRRENSDKKEDEKDDNSKEYDSNDNDSLEDVSIGVSTPPTDSKTKPVEKQDLIDKKDNKGNPYIMKDNKNKGILIESNENVSEDNDDGDNDSTESIMDEDSDELTSSESLIKAYSIKSLTNMDIKMLESPRQFSDDITASKHMTKHIRDKRNTHHKLRLLPLLNVMRKSKPSVDKNVQTHRIRKRQIPSFWEFLGGNNPQLGSHSIPQPFGSHPGFSRNLANPFTSMLNNQFQSGAHDSHVMSHPLMNTQPRLQNPQSEQFSFQNPQSGQLSIQNQQTGQLSLQNPQSGQLSLQNPHSGPFSLQSPELGQPSLHNSHFGNSPLDTPQLNQSPQQTLDKIPNPSLNQQKQNMFWPSPLSRNFPFHPPIGGYPQYHGYRGFHHPQFGYPGGYPGSNYEPGESPAAEAAADMEEILTGLFQRYWENVRNLFTTKGPSTTPEYEYEGPITPATTTKTTATTVTTITTKNTTKPTQANTIKTSPQSSPSPKSITAKHSKVTITTTPKTTNHSITLSNLNETQGMYSNSTFNTTDLNSTISINISKQEMNSSSVSYNFTTIPPANTTMLLPPLKPITATNAPPNRGSTFLFSLIKSLEMMTRKPAV